MLPVLILNLCKIHFILIMTFSFCKENTFFLIYWPNCNEKINLTSVDCYSFFFFPKHLGKNWLQLMPGPLYLCKNITWLIKC